MQEAACFVYLCFMGLLLLLGVNTISTLMQFYAIMSVLLFFHAIRIMVGHRYELNGEPQDRIEQVMDSFNFPKYSVVTSILAPLGFHLHALHHLFPKIPYHNMPEAHRRIAAALPKELVLSLRRVRQLLPRGCALHDAERRDARTEAGR